MFYVLSICLFFVVTEPPFFSSHRNLVKCLKLLLAVLVGIMDVTESKLPMGLVNFRHETNVGHWLFME